MLTAEEFAERMERVGQRVADLAEQPDDPASLAAADLLGTMSELHAAGLQRILRLIQARGETFRPLLEQFAQDDLIRSLLLCYDLHPIDLRTRLTEAVDELRPLVESYGGSVSVADISQDRVTVRLYVANSDGPSPLGMLQELLENAILVAAPDVAEIQFEHHSTPPLMTLELPIISVR